MSSGVSLKPKLERASMKVPPKRKGNAAVYSELDKIHSPQ